jgi:hypothetical protein
MGKPANRMQPRLTAASSCQTWELVKAVLQAVRKAGQAAGEKKKVEVWLLALKGPPMKGSSSPT